MKFCKSYVTQLGAQILEEAEEHKDLEAAADAAGVEMHRTAESEDETLIINTIGGTAVVVRTDKIDHIEVVPESSVVKALQEQGNVVQMNSEEVDVA